MSCWQFIDQQRSGYSVKLLCRILNVSSARYYTWRKQQRPALTQPVAEPWK
ncbi:transposase [Hymenobacter sp. RP-2-7]|uniref:Transposase n=1 Tax=Hymenobacter polaris TaxID=2682546 RepID=A0A7Y0AER5_9BACT|nr:transposase [Hymenobacter polaris]